MTSNYILPLKAPSPLPATGVDTVTFKVWKNTLTAHIQQDAHHHQFMPDGLYNTWRAAELGSRITVIVDEDPDKIALDEKRAKIGDNEYQRLKRKLLAQRNAQLAKYITHIATLVHHTENDDVTNHSTSLNWIFDYLKKHYGLETKGANFMNIAEHSFKQGTPFQTFYKQYRASFIDNLRKNGDIVKFKNDLVLTEDEKLSPSFENAIILWSLEKIDPRLPLKVKKNYGHQMTGNVTLKDIQPVIFENITLMLEELDQLETTKAFAAQSSDDPPCLNAMSFRGNKFKPANARGRASFRGGFQSRSSNSGRIGSKPSSSEKFCRLCNLAGSDPKVYTSHEIGQCSRLSIRDMESLKNAMVLNGMITLCDEEPPSTEPTCVLQPGWDDEEASSYQESSQ